MACCSYAALMILASLMVTAPLRVLAEVPPGMVQRADLDLSQLQHTAYGASQGAPPYSGNMWQDREGFLWLASANGLARFDGVRFDYPYVKRLSDYQAVVQSFTDAQGNLWLGHAHGGVTELTKNTLVHTDAGHDGLPMGSAFGFVQDAHDVVWAITAGGVVRRVGGRWVRVGNDMAYPGTHPEQLFKVPASGDIYLEDAEGKYVLRPGAARFAVTEQDFDRLQIALPASIPWHYDSTTDGDALLDRGGVLWVVGLSGVDRLRWSGKPPGKLPAHVEHAGHAEGLTSDAANNLFEDREGNVWLSTAKGLDRFSVTALTPVVLPGNISGPNLALASDGSTWIASRFEPPMELRDGRVTAHPEWDADGGDSAIFADADGLWMAGVHGLRHGEHGKVVTIPAPAELSHVGTRYRAIARDGQGHLWAAISTYGVYRIVNKEWQAHGGRTDLPAGDPDFLTADHRGRIWLAYPDNRLAVVDGARLTVYTQADGLAVGDVFDVSFRGDHAWVTGSKGIAQLAGGRFQSLRGHHENFDHAGGIAETAQGDLWISTTHGIFRVDRKELARWRGNAGTTVTSERFDTRDGIDGFPEERPIPSLVQGADGRLWFAGNGGISFIDPDHVLHNNVAPQPLIQSVTGDGKSYGVQDGLRLPPLTQQLHIDFTAASLRMPERVRFDYRLDGFDADWLAAGSLREASYAHLPPGNYTFRVRAFNEDGVPGVQPAVMHFALAPAWYQTWWFRVVVALLTLAGLWLLSRWQVRVARMRVHAEQEARAGERERIARDLHDTLLQGVQGMLLQVQSSVGGEDSPERAQRLELAMRRAHDSVVEARDKVAALRSENDDGLSLSASLGGLGQQLAVDHAIGFSQVDVGSEARLQSDVREQAFLIGSELLRNAFVHAQASQVRLRVACERRQLVLIVYDDGCGIDDAVLAAGGRPGHWGMTGMRERAAQLRGRMVFESDLGGTDATLTVPADVAYKPRG